VRAGAFRRGSLEIGDMLGNLTAAPMETTLLGRQGRVHEGMLSAATYVHCNTGGALEDAARRFPGWPLLITGHSMGGARPAVLAPRTLGAGAACFPEGRVWSCSLCLLLRRGHPQARAAA